MYNIMNLFILIHLFYKGKKNKLIAGVIKFFDIFIIFIIFLYDNFRGELL
jgi:hypothetical protein